jgi:hypothetical protein
MTQSRHPAGRRTPMGHCLPAMRGSLSVCYPCSAVMINRLSVFHLTDMTNHADDVRLPR